MADVLFSAICKLHEVEMVKQKTGCPQYIWKHPVLNQTIIYNGFCTILGFASNSAWGIGKAKRLSPEAITNFDQ